MAGQTLVLDASVGVKWISDKGESSLRQALSIRDAHLTRDLIIVVPDLFYYEVANAIIHKSRIPTDDAQLAIKALFALGLITVPLDSSLMMEAARLSREFNITIYDSCYMAVAIGYNCPLVTANPRHQQNTLGCQVIPVEHWHMK